MLIDGDTIITGSFNFTKAAENSNAENPLVLKGSPELFEKYAANYAEHRAHFEAYERPSGTRAPCRPIVALKATIDFSARALSLTGHWNPTSCFGFLKISIHCATVQRTIPTAVAAMSRATKGIERNGSALMERTWRGSRGYRCTGMGFPSRVAA